MRDREENTNADDLSAVSPLRYTLAPRANTDLENAVDWLMGTSQESAQRFIQCFNAEVATLCQHLAEQISAGRPAGQIDEAASLAYSQPVYSRLFTTQKKRIRRSSTGVWRIFFTLADKNSDGQVDTLRVLSVRHAAARPVWDPEGDK